VLPEPIPDVLAIAIDVAKRLDDAEVP